jgi:hypothetical protein
VQKAQLTVSGPYYSNRRLSAEIVAQNHGGPLVGGVTERWFSADIFAQKHVWPLVRAVSMTKGTCISLCSSCVENDYLLENHMDANCTLLFLHNSFKNMFVTNSFLWSAVPLTLRLKKNSQSNI